MQPPHRLVILMDLVWIVKLKHWVDMNSTRGEMEANMLWWRFKMGNKRSSTAMHAS